MSIKLNSITIEKGQWYYDARTSMSSGCSEGTDIKWYSDDSSVASVNETTGYIYGVNAGTTKIYATTCDGSCKIGYITVTVIVPIPVTGISLSATSLTMNAGDTEHIYKTIYPSNATNQKVTWESSACEKAIRADMAIGEETQSGITDQYYDLNSAIVQEQILYHGQK